MCLWPYPDLIKTSKTEIYVKWHCVNKSQSPPRARTWYCYPFHRSTEWEAVKIITCFPNEISYQQASPCHLKSCNRRPKKQETVMKREALWYCFVWVFVYHRSAVQFAYNILAHRDFETAFFRRDASQQSWGWGMTSNNFVITSPPSPKFYK